MDKTVANCCPFRPRSSSKPRNLAALRWICEYHEQKDYNLNATYPALFLSICLQRSTTMSLKGKKTHEIQDIDEDEDGHALVQFP